MNKEQFEALTEKEQRVVLAKDALKWIDAGILKPMSMVYLEPLDEDYVYGDKASLKTLIESTEGFKCEVCARGALFAANAAKVNGSIAENAPMEASNFTGAFGPEVMNDIEEAFESPMDFPLTRSFQKEYVDRDDFGRDDATADPRLRAILWNIIDNGGDFDPEQEPRDDLSTPKDFYTEAV